MIVVHFYDEVTGLISEEPYKTSSRDPAAAIAANTPKGFKAIRGVRDALSQRVDLDSEVLVDHQPPQPTGGHEWNSHSKRWVKRADVTRQESADAIARDRIAKLEMQQARRVRELLAAGDPRLAAIDDEIASLRAVLSAGRDTSA